uniref:Fork-head domain-containing protein n=1 Tax=Gorilla gorilla gorilla TaxID=9595 RepID=G3RKP6_GORGO
MGPVMPPSKMPESSGVSVSSGLSQCYWGSGFSKGPWKMKSSRSRAWTMTAPVPTHSDMPYDASCLIFMAIEDSPTKRLPVKDIYNWILKHFPYFANAPTGWKYSVRHNLSLNKDFKKVDEERSQSIGKGSLWCMDPEYRQNLTQALKKTPYHPHPHPHVFNTPPTCPQAYQSTSGLPVWPGSTFFKRNGALLQDPDIDATRVLKYNDTKRSAGPELRGLFPGVRQLPISPIEMTAAMMYGITSCRMRTESEPSCGSLVVSGDPKEDHNCTNAKSSNARSTLPTSDSIPSSSLADDHYKFASKESQEGNEGSEGSFRSHESHSDREEDDRKHSQKEPRDALGDSAYASKHKKRQDFAKARKVRSDTLPLKKRRTGEEEEIKEAAGSLLHLGEIRSCLNNITNRTAKGQEEQNEITKKIKNKSLICFELKAIWFQHVRRFLMICGNISIFFLFSCFVFGLVFFFFSFFF